MPAKPPPTTTTVSRRSRSGPGGQHRRLVEVRHQAVADRDGLFDRLEPDRVVGDAGDREGARDGTGGDDDLVVLVLVRLARDRRDRGDLVRVVDARDLRGDDVRALEVTTERDHRVTGLDRAGGDLGEERLVRHVRQRVDDRDLGFALAEVLLELPRGVETGVAATDDEDLGHGVRHGGTTPLGQRRRRASARRSDASDSSGDAERHQYTGDCEHHERQGAVAAGCPATAEAGIPARVAASAAGSGGDLDRRRRSARAAGSRRRATVQADPLREAAHRVLGRPTAGRRRDGGRGIHESVAVERIGRRLHRPAAGRAVWMMPVDDVVRRRVRDAPSAPAPRCPPRSAPRRSCRSTARAVPSADTPRSFSLGAETPIVMPCVDASTLARPVGSTPADRQHAGDRRGRADAGRAAPPVARRDDDHDVVLERVEEGVVPALVPVEGVRREREVDDVGAVVDGPAHRLGDLLGERHGRGRAEADRDRQQLRLGGDADHARCRVPCRAPAASEADPAAVVGVDGADGRPAVRRSRRPRHPCRRRRRRANSTGPRADAGVDDRDRARPRRGWSATPRGCRSRRASTRRRGPGRLGSSGAGRRGRRGRAAAQDGAATARERGDARSIRRAVSRGARGSSARAARLGAHAARRATSDDSASARSPIGLTPGPAASA